MDTNITLNSIVNALAILITVGGGMTVIWKGIKSLNAIHDKMEEWNKNTEEIKALDSKIDSTHEATTNAIKQIQEETNEKIEEMHSDTDAKLQELKAEQYMMVTVLQAVLDGLKQLNCNGTVTETKEKLDEYITQKAYK